jgi:thioesterase domain-containing protein
MAAKGAAKGTLNAKNLEALGAARLAELLIVLCEGNNASKRLLRLALAEHKGPLEMARELRKRLASIARAGSLLDDHQGDELLRELERQRQAICGPIAAHDADLAVDLLWEVLELSAELIERCDDRDAVLRDWFHQVSAALGQVALAARGKPQNLADQVYAAVVSNSYGQFDPIVRDLGPALGSEGLAHLRLRLETLRQRSSGTATAKTQPDWIVSIAMLDIADALGDAEAYLAEYRDHSPEALTVPAIAAEVAERLTKAGRAEESLTLLQAADPTLRRRSTGAEAWCDARLAALEALGRSDEAQAQRWEFALLELSGRHLRDYLKRLPAFEDMPAEEKALDLVAEHDDLEEALWFLLHWPEPHRAARLVLAAPKPLNGDRYILLAPLAELLEQRQPLAATVCLRAMVDFTLKVKRPKRYPHAARHLETCHRLAAAINDWGELVDHRSYMAQLRRDHGRKYGFWGEVPKTIIPEAETEAKAVDKGVGKAGREGRGLRGASPAHDEAGSVQPGLW